MTNFITQSHFMWQHPAILTCKSPILFFSSLLVQNLWHAPVLFPICYWLIRRLVLLAFNPFEFSFQFPFTWHSPVSVFSFLWLLNGYRYCADHCHCFSHLIFSYILLFPFLLFSLYGSIIQQTHHLWYPSAIMTCDWKWIFKQSTTYHLYIVASLSIRGVFPITQAQLWVATGVHMEVGETA